MGSSQSSGPQVVLLEHCRLGQTLFGYTEACPIDYSLRQTIQGYLEAGQNATLIEENVILLPPKTKGWPGPRRVNINNSRWKQVESGEMLRVGPPCETANGPNESNVEDWDLKVVHFGYPPRNNS